MDDVRKYILNILSDVKQMVISTSDNGKPWSVTVFFAFDNNFNIYFFSRPERRHSKEIAKNPNISGAIAREHKLGLAEPSIGISFEGVCSLVSKDDIDIFYEVYRKRFPEIVNVHDKEDAHKELYKIDLSKIVLFDIKNYPDDPRKEIVL